MNSLRTISLETTKEELNYTISSDEYNRLINTGILSFQILNRFIKLNLHTKSLVETNMLNRIIRNYKVKKFINN